MEKPSLMDASPEELEAFVQAVVLVAYADGDLSSAEKQVLVTRVHELAGGRIDDAHMQDLMVELPPLSRDSTNWRADRMARLRKSLPNESHRNEAFRLAVEVARSDDKIGLREGRMLVNLVTELGIDAAAAQLILARK